MSLNAKVYCRVASILSRLMLAGMSLFPCRCVGQSVGTAKTLVDRVVLVSGEAYCIPIMIHPDKAINLGAGQLTITFSSNGKEHDDVVLVSRITKPEMAILKGPSPLMLCGAVPQLNEKQTGLYFASDFATHFGSGNVTNIGTPDNSLLDANRLVAQLKALHITFKR